MMWFAVGTVLALVAFGYTCYSAGRLVEYTPAWRKGYEFGRLHGYLECSEEVMKIIRKEAKNGNTDN